jgi:hypothetical protein
MAYALTYTTNASVTEDISDSGSVVSAPTTTANTIITATDTADAVDIFSDLLAQFSSVAESASGTDAVTTDMALWIAEAVTASVSASSQLNTAVSAADTAAFTDTLRVLLQELLDESVNAADGTDLAIGVLLADLISAYSAASANISANTLVAEILVAVDLAKFGLLADIDDTANAAVTAQALLETTQAILDQVTATVSTSSYVLMFSDTSDAVSLADAITTWQNSTADITDTITLFLHLSYGGLCTGWVTNTQKLATSEYQALTFNSLARIGNRYFGANDEGVFELTGSDDDGTDIHSYIQSGLMDFGTSLYKSVPTAYLGVDVDGRIAVGVGVSEKTGVAQYWYEVSMDKEAPDNVRSPIGRGLKGRYWKFEVASEALSTFDALTVLPVVLTRRV